jgi:predicted lipoprotein with Yx(FWY)xxD motif
MNTNRTYTSLLALAAVAVMTIVSACGGSDGSGSGESVPEDSSAAQTVSVSAVDGVGQVLVDAQGAALYAANEEAGGMVRCTGSCTAVWDPLTLAGDDPTAGDGLRAKLGVVERPDGTRQVTFDSRPLYRFVEDTNPGTVTGNGLADTFDGRAFTWHVVTPAGVSTSSTNSGSSGGGYGY